MSHNQLLVKLGPFDHSDSMDLLCPKCKCDYLHHGPVEVFNRKEDKEAGLHVMIHEDRLSSDSSMGRNPSDRRHGITIDFNCEGCGGYFKLCIAQHKGQTKIMFEPTEGAWESSY